ncbi:MAG: hypothetical protein IPO87_10735 [Flavobacteriales bacterium]|nr:hypothetical protein [Flavobacteriales bacterium]
MKRPAPYQLCLRLWWHAAVLVCWVGSLPYAHSQNLVPNAGFEEADTCSTMGFGFEGPSAWHSANGTPITCKAVSLMTMHLGCL